MTHFIANMKLSNQLRWSFLMLVILLLIVSAASFLGLKNADKSFNQYRGLAVNTNLAGRLQANLLYTRLSVLKYLKENDVDVLTDYQERIDNVKRFIGEAEQKITDPERAALIRESKTDIANYEQNFSAVVKLIEQRHKIVSTTLDPTGLAMRVVLTDLIEANRNSSVEKMYLLAKLQESLLLGRLYVVKFLVTNDMKDANRAHDELMKNNTAVLNNAQKVTQEAASLAQFEKYSSLKNEYIEALYAIEKTIIDRNLLIDKLNQIGPKVADNLEKIKLSIKDEQDDLGPKVVADTESTLKLVSVISLAALVFGFIAAYFLPNVIRKPIGGEPNDIAAITAKIAKGDLSQDLSQQASMTGILKSISYMSASLKSVVLRIITNGNAINDAAIESSNIARTTNNVVNEQRERTAQIATAINEMSYSIQEVVKLSSSSAESANEAKHSAEGGLVLIDQTVNAINHLSHTIEHAMKAINDLAQSSDAIGAVVEVIRKISEQTNLLALNAAIEAARAGEQGRGFSVVADEVRSLAKRTQESTNEIQTMIETLQSGTQAAVTSMASSSQEAMSSVDLSENTRESLTQILAMISTINDMNNQVAVAVEEQSSVCEDINQNITGIAQSSETSAQSAQLAEKSSEKMAELAQELGLIAKEFKVN